MDRRQQKTQKAIFNALAELLSDKSYTKITVQEIIEKADIGRSTFYAHFETKDELLKAVCTELFNHVFSKTLSNESTHDFSANPNSTRSIFTHILYHLRDNNYNLIRLLSNENNNVFITCFKKYLNELITTHMLKNTVRKNTAISETFLLNHISCSFIGMVQWWIENDMNKTPEDLITDFENVILPII